MIVKVHVIILLCLCLASLPISIAVLKAISMVARELSEPPTKNRDPLNTASSFSIIRRRFHPLGPQAALHSAARTKVEQVLNEVLKLVGEIDTIDDEDMETVFDFAKCIDPTTLFNCSTPTINQLRTIDGTYLNHSWMLPTQSSDALNRPSMKMVFQFQWDMHNKQLTIHLDHLGLVQGLLIKLS